MLPDAYNGIEVGVVGRGIDGLDVMPVQRGGLVPAGICPKLRPTSRFSLGKRSPPHRPQPRRRRQQLLANTSPAGWLLHPQRLVRQSKRRNHPRRHHCSRRFPPSIDRLGRLEHSIRALVFPSRMAERFTASPTRKPPVLSPCETHLPRRISLRAGRKPCFMKRCCPSMSSIP